MSTNINITVGDNALLDRAKQQQAANRQAQLNREASTRLEAQATAARTTAQAAQGLDANGNPIFGAPFTQPQIDRRPAANRRPGGYPVATAFRTSDLRLYIRCSDLVTSNVNQDITFQDPSYQIPVGDPFTFGAPGGFDYRKTRALWDVFNLPLNKNTFIWCYFIREAFLEYSILRNTPEFGINTTTPGPFGQTTKGACMLIGPNSARDILMPSQLLARLGVLNPPFDIDVVPSIVSGSSPSNYGIGANNTGFTSVYFQPESSLYFEDPLTNFYTPSIYDYIRQTNTSPSVAPKVTLKPCGLAGTCVFDLGIASYSSYGFDFTRNPDNPVPTYQRNPAGRVKMFTESVPFSWVESGTTVFSQTGSLNRGVFGAWDWGRPDYCRQQLLALGFTTADLTP